VQEVLAVRFRMTLFWINVLFVGLEKAIHNKEESLDVTILYKKWEILLRYYCILYITLLNGISNSWELM